MKNRAKRDFSDGFVLVAEEPFRLFFPTGACLGLVGVSLWIFYYAGWQTAYPNIAHARLMIEGFMAAFIFGFLGTAGPRLMDVPHFSRVEILIIFTVQVLAAGFHVEDAHRAGDICFLIALIAFVAGLARRFGKRKDSPPPNFVLVGLGLLSGLCGTILLIYSEDLLFSASYQIGAGLLNQCFVLLPVAGVAPFFICRLLDQSSPSKQPERSQLWIALLTGAAILASIPLEVLYSWRGGAALRGLAVIAYIIMSMPWRGRTPLAQAMRLSLFAIVAGFVLITIYPLARVGLLHLVFITGFNLIAFTVATRVVFGHSGNLGRLGKPMWFFRVTALLLFVAMLARVTADFSPQARVLHLVSAAVVWLIGAILWMACVLPKVTKVESESA